jgi:hypothetical protein
MTVVRHLGQAVLLLALLGCIVRRLAVTIGNHRIREPAAAADDGPIWIRDQRGGGVRPGGDVGFHHRDHPGVLVTYSYYAAVDEENPATTTVERETEYLVYTDPDDPGGSEVWSAYRPTAVLGRFGTVRAATDAVLQAAQRHLVCEDPWAGRPPWTQDHEEERR